MAWNFSLDFSCYFLCCANDCIRHNHFCISNSLEHIIFPQFWCFREFHSEFLHQTSIQCGWCGKSLWMANKKRAKKNTLTIICRANNNNNDVWILMEKGYKNREWQLNTTRKCNNIISYSRKQIFWITVKRGVHQYRIYDGKKWATWKTASWRWQKKTQLCGIHCAYTYVCIIYCLFSTSHISENNMPNVRWTFQNSYSKNRIINSPFSFTTIK